MTMHPYIGRVFKARRYPYTGPDAGKNDINGAVCVWVGQAGSAVTEGDTMYASAIVRDSGGEHHEVAMVWLVGPLDEPVPAVATREKWETVTLPYWERPPELTDSSAVEVGAWRPLAPATNYVRYDRDDAALEPEFVIVWTRRLLFAVEGA